MRGSVAETPRARLDEVEHAGDGGGPARVAPAHLDPARAQRSVEGRRRRVSLEVHGLAHAQRDPDAEAAQRTGAVLVLRTRLERLRDHAGRRVA